MAAGQTKGGSTQRFTEILDIQEDIVLLTGGNACLVVEVQAVNFALLSREEQDAKVYSYASLLNSLSFSVQILIRNKRVDISSYLKLLDAEVQKTQNEKLATNIALYRDFVQELVQVNSVLDKNFYLIVSYSSLEKGVSGVAGKGGKSAFFDQAKASLHGKAEAVHGQLSRVGLLARTLEKEELVTLFYNIFNQDLQQSNIATDSNTPMVRSN